MDVKKRKLSLAVVVAICFIWLGWTSMKIYHQKKDLKEIWKNTYTRAKDISDITPNFIYLGKTTSLHNDELLTKVARLRLALEQELKASQGRWSVKVIEIINQLILEQDELARELEKKAGPETRNYVQELQVQWKIRKEVYEKERKGFDESHKQYDALKNSMPGFFYQLFDKEKTH